MAEASVSIQNSLGIHARPATMIVQLANKYPTCSFEISKDGKKVNGKSIMGVMMLEAGPGTELKFHASGEGEGELLKQMVELVERKFDEE